jgi:TRAP transporter 4TM/12TM fusion protein
MMTALLVLRTDPFLAAFWANLSVIIIGAFYKESKMRFRDILDTLEWGTKNALSIGVACACVGFIVGATTLTGLGLKFAAAVLGLAHGVAYGLMSVQDFIHFQMLTSSDYTLFFTLVFTAIACFILGMGIPTTAQYIIAVMIAAPALMQWHIHPLLSHMFVFFYAVLADVTPPVALAAFAAAGISGADPFKTGFTAFNLSMAKVFVPFAFIYSPLVLLLPRLLDPTASFDVMGFILLVITLFTGVTALGATFIGYLVAKSTILERIGTGIAGLCLIIPGEMSDLVGIILFAGIYFIQKMRTRRLKAAAANAAPTEA